MTPPPEAGTYFEEAVKEVFYAHHRRYGTRRLRAEFQAKGHRVGRQRLRHPAPVGVTGAPAQIVRAAYHGFDARPAVCT